MTPRFKMHLVWFGLALAALAACSGSPAPDYYVLRAPQNTLPTAHCHAHRMLVVERPDAGEEYDSKRIAVLLSGNQLTYFNDANWASPLPDQLQDFMVDEFAQSGRFSLVSREGDDTHASTVLALQIEEANVLHTVDGSVTNVHLRMTALLRDGMSQRTIRTIPIDETVAAAQNHMPDIVKAFNIAASNAASHIAASIKPTCQ